MARVRLNGDAVRLGLVNDSVTVHLPDTPTVDGAWPETAGDAVSAPGVPPAEQPDPGSALDGPTFTIQARSRVSYDLDGVAQFDWAPLFTGASASYMDRVETDAVTGTTRITAEVTIPYDGGVEVTETAQAIELSTPPRVWSVTKVQQTPDRVELTLLRTQAEVAADESVTL